MYGISIYVFTCIYSVRNVDTRSFHPFNISWHQDTDFVYRLANVQYVDVDLSSWKMNIYFLLRCFPTVNSVLNPFIYSFCNPKFRRESRCLLMKMCNTFLSRLWYPVQSVRVPGEEIGTAKPQDSSILFNLLIKCNHNSIITVYISGNTRLCYDSVC